MFKKEIENYAFILPFFAHLEQKKLNYKWSREQRGHNVASCVEILLALRADTDSAITGLLVMSYSYVPAHSVSGGIYMLVLSHATRSRDTLSLSMPAYSGL